MFVELNLKTYKNEKKGSIKRKSFRRQIKSIDDSLWTYSNEIKVETIPVQLQTNTLKDLIESKYDFKVDVEIQEASLTGNSVVADKHNKCLIVDSEFDVDKDMGDFIVQYLYLTNEKNVIVSLSDYIIKLIKKQ